MMGLIVIVGFLFVVGVFVLKMILLQVVLDAVFQTPKEQSFLGACERGIQQGIQEGLAKKARK